MNVDRRTGRPAPVLALAVLALVGCGESDLEELHDGALADALAAERAGEPDAGIAPPSSGEREPDVGAAEPTDEPLAPGEGYTLVFAEEFDDASLDESRWNTALDWGPDVVIYDQQQYYVDSLGDPDFGHSPFVLDGETLTVRAIETPETLRAAANEQPWLSGALTTAGRFDFTYGYAEARVSMPTGQGVWPMFWMSGAEFDGLLPQLFVMERDGAKPDSVFHNYEYTDAAGSLRSPGQFEIVEDGLAEGFHTVAVAWSPEEFLFFLDGEPRYRIVGENVAAQDMYLALGLAIGGNWTGPFDASTPRPVEWTIDYVRVWQRDGER